MYKYKKTMEQQSHNVIKHPLLRRGLGRLLLSFFFLSSGQAVAQTQFTQRIQQDVQAGARITIHQDDAITELVNGKPAATTTPRQNSDRPRQQNNDRPRQQNNDNNNNNNNQSSGRTESSAETTTTSPVQETDSIAVVPRRTRKMAGYRVQPFVGGNSRADRVKAEQTGATLQTLFPGHRVYVHFLGGKWTCRLGDFRTMAEAKEVLDELVKMGYDRAMMVRGQINVPY